MKKRCLFRKLLFQLLGKFYNVVFPHRYLVSYTNYLKAIGVKIDGFPNYISSDAYFDGHDYSKIHLSDGVVISREAMLLCHDYSIARGIQALRGGEKYWKNENVGTPHFLGEISIGQNSFIGARASLLPNTHIGNNCIIGAGTVVKGIIPDNSIVIGNPAKVIGNTQDWARKHIEQADFII